jgi:hypothetical protein
MKRSIGETSPENGENSGNRVKRMSKISNLLKAFENPEKTEESSVVKKNLRVFEELGEAETKKKSFKEKIAKFKISRTKTFSKPNIVKKKEVEKSSNLVGRVKEKFLGMEIFNSPDKKASTSEGSKIRESLKSKKIFVKVLPTDSSTAINAKPGQTDDYKTMDLEVPSSEEIEKEFEIIFEETKKNLDKTSLEIEKEFEKIYQNAD